MSPNAIAITPRTLGEIESLADKFAKSTLIPDALRNKPADVLVSIMAGAELGLPPMAAIRGVFVVQGKPVLSADTMVGVVLGSGHAIYFSCIESTSLLATYETQRKGSPAPQRMTFTIEQAKKAKLIKDDGNWAKYPDAMLRARAKAALARDVYPDVLAGCFDFDEAAEFASPQSRPLPPARESVPNAIDVEIVEKAPAEDLAALASAAGSMADLQALAPRISALAKGTPERAAAASAYNARKAELVPPAAEVENAPAETAA